MRGFVWSTERHPIHRALQEVMVDTAHGVALLLNEMPPALRETALRMSAEIERRVMHGLMHGEGEAGQR